MAKGTYISINTANIGAASAQAKALGGKMETTRNELNKLQSQLSQEQNVLEKHFGMCFYSAVPTRRLQDQKQMMDQVVSLLAEAEQLAQESTNKLNNKTSALQLAVKAMGGLTATVYTSAVSLITSALTGERECGDDWVDLSNWGPTADEICSEMKARYQRTLEATNRTSFSGACSAFVYRQLRDAGVFGSKDSGVASGKDYYKVWGKKAKTSTGYQIESYGYDPNAKNNPLEDLISAHSGETLNNIVVSLDQRKGFFPSEHGHVMLITAIQDGNVFFMESQSGSFHALKNGKAYAEGDPLVLPINDFLKQYPSMNGVIRFHKDS